MTPRQQQALFDEEARTAAAVARLRNAMAAQPGPFTRTAQVLVCLTLGGIVLPALAAALLGTPA